ncbi:pre-mRNA-splicing factor 38B family protein [Babesia bovis T2Bo]|uniref:pre-mRNA-splicing factor 38B family protein n=1 Tax=Babesia bovis T2Bo TaxID=484906 RepID=UPI001C3577BC|nr:pre-mRNA-splicing factor 38B family protein [Babesia bovis T2Bo]EDO08447.2 pre-mRNA-splicing factor 38B family protein [Babesia bovis T2Bo]
MYGYNGSTDPSGAPYPNTSDPGIMGNYYGQGLNENPNAASLISSYPGYYGYGSYGAYVQPDTASSTSSVNVGIQPIATELGTSDNIAAASVPGHMELPPTSVSYTTHTEDLLESVQTCHMHTKPDLNCKFCRKYKSAVHELSRLSQLRSQEATERPDQLDMTNSSTYNMNTLLLNNILNSDYYKSLSTMTSHHSIIDELAQYADHVEPYCKTATRVPSTLFCCLHKLFTLRLTERQMEDLIDCTKSPYPRCCGFLYLRFVLPSDQLWAWFEPYLMDEETFVMSVNPTRKTTIGKFCESLLVEDRYFNTVLPRLPSRFKNMYGPYLCGMDEHRRRRVRNLENYGDFVPGKKVSAFVKGEWVDVKIESVDLDYPTVTVQLSNGESESLDVAYISLSKTSQPGNKRHRDESIDDRDRKGTGNSSVRHGESREALFREYKRRESDRVLAVGLRQAPVFLQRILTF